MRNLKIRACIMPHLLGSEEHRKVAKEAMEELRKMEDEIGILRAEAARMRSKDRVMAVRTTHYLECPSCYGEVKFEGLEEEKP